ncbi:MAG TPA: hypothetical protein RMH85_09500 [Polyangiaceae bacterium LLY-WYZ-15_(1-7)]|nr:hypothetical protein [Myxococcales bacterium]HJK89544.1 hypothetical protein [Polyangiaceae bacterium LLY-WYZ-15_(1-7)]HJL01682.1 hypothetical protein [Polyangiaceae bacterium LLY-WYZ-15_(1-7)]HJL08722.1 hypothetical protein [Polyangiaceae bacterium LLY-WYZ-15_(1-7)]HJL32673.1 hypothetical protein [Polyangiaceae bacterium LLY-WYZ-15_(1-7)]
MSPAPALVAGLYWLIAAVVLGAAVLVMHVYATWRVVRSDVEPSWWKWIAVVPPVTPVAAWVAGQKKTAGAWVLLLAAYGVVRLIAG